AMYDNREFRDSDLAGSVTSEPDCAGMRGRKLYVFAMMPWARLTGPASRGYVARRWTTTEEESDEDQGGEWLCPNPQDRGHPVGELLSHQSREQRPRRRGRAHPHDGRGALRRRRGRRLLAGDEREADRGVHG